MPSMISWVYNTGRGSNRLAHLKATTLTVENDALR